MKRQVDVVIIGAGPAGLTAGLYASRSGLETVILDRGAPGGEVVNTFEVENYPGVGKVTGVELGQNIYEQAISFGAEYINGTVESVDFSQEIKKVTTDQTTYLAPAVIIATGAKNRKLNVPGEEEFMGQGVSYCAVCDGFFCRGLDLVVVGGGDSAVEEGTYLTQFANKVTIIHRRDELRAQEVLVKRAQANDKVDFMIDTVVKEIKGSSEAGVESVVVENTKTGEESTLECGGVFIYVGITPNTGLFSDLGISDAEGWIETDVNMMTQIPGVFAAGDVRKTPLRQVATAVGDGAIAGMKAYDYIQSLG